MWLFGLVRATEFLGGGGSAMVLKISGPVEVLGSDAAVVGISLAHGGFDDGGLLGGLGRLVIEEDLLVVGEGLFGELLGGIEVVGADAPNGGFLPAGALVANLQLVRAIHVRNDKLLY